jgi:hypothetical protein
MRSSWLYALLLWVLVGCGAPVRTVRVVLENGDPITRPLPPRSAPALLPVREWSDALARLVLDVPLSVQPEQAGRMLRASTSQDWGQVDRGLQAALRRDYGRWCEQYESRGDCLSLLEDGLGFDDFDRLRVAVAFALDPAWDGVTEAVREVADARVLKAMLVSSVAAYALLLAAPEPVLTKGLPLVLTAYMVAYLGVGPFLDVVRACADLRRGTQHATTFSALADAGARFGQVLGRNGARIVIMLMTAALGGKAAGLATRGPGLPGFAQAATTAEAEVGLVLSAASGVRSLAVSGNGRIQGRLTMTSSRLRARPGDLLEVRTSRGLAYLRYTARHSDFGDTVRVLPGFHDTRPHAWTGMDEQTGYFAFYPVGAAVRQGLLEVVGNHPLPDGLKLPAVLRRPGARSRDGRVLGWLVCTGTEEVLKSELSSEERQLPIGVIWNHELLLLRLATEWHPAREA